MSLQLVACGVSTTNSTVSVG